MSKICGTVILYNPTEEIITNIDSYYFGLDRLFLIDNSETIDQNLKNIIVQKYPNIEYVENGENLGIATALNIACDKAISLGYDWILTMDQDSQFLNFSDYLNCLFKFYYQNNLALLAANTQWHAKNYLTKNPSCNYEEKFLVITSGNFLNLNLFNKVGRFEDKLFIDMVDHDYCMKVHLQGYKIYYFSEIMIEHSLGTLFQRKNLFTRRIRNKIEHNPLRVYYITRNYFYTWKTYSSKFPKEFNLLKAINIMFVHGVVKILLYEDQKIKKLYAKFLGFWHFLIGKYGKL